MDSDLGRRPTRWGTVTAIFLAGLFVYGYRLWDAPLDRTEPHRALVAHQMVGGGNWLLPRLNGELYLRKPPGIYWVEAAAEKITGVAEPWVWRLPSVVGSALLAAVLAWWAGRWFGAAAVAAAGVACLALIPLWDQNRGADIDAANTVAAVVTAMVVLELNHGPAADAGRWRVAWTIVLGLSAATVLLLKGPAGLPPVIGALVGPSLALRNWRWTRRAGVWVGLAIGVAAFIAWGVAVKVAIRRAGVVGDTGGVREGLQRMVLHRAKDVIPALVAPLTVLAYAVPVVLAVPFAIGVARRDPVGAVRRVRIVALLATVGAGLAVFVVAGNNNPRYEYVLLPPLAVAVGAVAAAGLAGRERTLARWGLTAAVLLFVGLGGVLTFVPWKAGVDRPGLVVAGLLAGAAEGVWLLGYRRAWVAGWVVVALAVPMGDRKNVERRQRSAIAAADQLRRIVGGGEVAVASMNRDMPELMYYAGVPVRAFGERGLPKLAAEPGGRWAIVTQSKLFPERDLLAKQVPGAFPRGLTKLALPATAKEQVYVGWYDPPAGVPRTVVMPPTPADEGDVGNDQ